MNNTTIEDILHHRISEDELRQHGISLSDLGISLRLEQAHCFYMDKQGLAIRMNDGSYLTAAHLRQLVDKKRQTRMITRTDFRLSTDYTVP